MLHRISKYFRKTLQKHRQKKQLTAREFNRIAEEMLYLAHIAERINPEQNQTLDNLRTIKTEMDKLSQLVNSREFTKIPDQARLELRESMLTTRKKLMETINGAQPPTTTLQ